MPPPPPPRDPQVLPGHDLALLISPLLFLSILPSSLIVSLLWDTVPFGGVGAQEEVISSVQNAPQCHTPPNKGPTLLYPFPDP